MIVRRSIAVIIVLIGIEFAADAIWQSVLRQRALHVVNELGGRMTSLPFLTRADYSISFRDCELTATDLDRFSVFDSLARHNSVAVAFEDTNITQEHINSLRKRYPQCHFLLLADHLSDHHR